MRLSFALIYIFFSSFLLLAGCQNANTKPKKAKISAAKKKQVKKKKTAKIPIKAKFGLTDAQVKKVNSINAVFDKRINILKKKKKWLGKANDATRKNIAKAKDAELKKVLGSKFSAYKNYIKGLSKKKKKGKKIKKKKK